MSRQYPLVAILFGVAALGVAVLVGPGAGPETVRPEAWPGLVLAALLLSTLKPASVPGREWMRPSFVCELAVLLVWGPAAASFTAASVEVTHGLAVAPGRFRPLASLLQAATVAAAFQAAGAAFQAAGAVSGAFDWPWQAVPVAAAVVAYLGVRTGVAAVVVPLVERRPIEREWRARLPRYWPPYVIGASLAVGIAELTMREAWAMLAVLLVPLSMAYRLYGLFVDGCDEGDHRREVIDVLREGMCVVDVAGDITLWSDTLERLVGCSRGRAVGRRLAQAVPALSGAPLLRAVQDAMRTGESCEIPRVAVPVATGVRTVRVRIVPVSGGATLLWHDLAEHTREESAVRRSAERLALAAEAANDGLWALDLRTRECYFSGRWRGMIGLPPQACAGPFDDWLARVHPEDVAGLQEAIEAHVAGRSDQVQHEHRIRHEDGTYRWFLCRAVAARGPDGRAMRLGGSLTDRAEATIARDRLTSVGSLDPLTGLANRSVFIERLGRRLAEAKAQPGGEGFAVLYLDLDRFKVVNDSLGHPIGDELLTAVSRRLEGCLRPHDVLARLGGDEFAILVNRLGDEQQANAVAFRIQETLRAPFAIGGREVFTTASIGIALGLTQYANPGDIMRDADTAMYHAKSHGKARHELFDADMHARVRDRLGLESDLRNAVASTDFEVHYQPIVLLATGMCVGFESLIRWKRNGQAVSPDTFIPLAEELGLIEPLGTWVLRQACRTFADWQRRFPDSRLDYITVNVSSRQLLQHNFLSLVEKAVHEAGLRPCDLRLEITETALMDSPHVAANVLRELRDFGVKIYLDDFGTGYSSLSHLHRLPVDALKIDRSFVRFLQLADRPAIVESILALARTLNTSVVAEGIETAAQAHELERLGCTHAQGYLFARPLATDAAEAMLAVPQPLGPKRLREGDEDQPAGAGRTASVPFVWPDHIPVPSPAGDDRRRGLAQAS